MRAAKSLSFFLLSLILIVGTPALAVAQQQEKRIALVVGNGAYAKTPLATAANDAGLIAQTLQAAGFDVVGARDLDGDTLRKSFREFIQKAETSGPDTVAMVYLAGYGMQLAGENYFIPVDSTISRETDIPVEGLRISDYLRLLASLPLKAGIVVLDAARPQPFIEGGQPIASGLALVEPEPHMLIAFNAAPGTVAPVEEGSYGAYAQAVAEMIRTGGLPLPELFDRVRLRVNEATKGAQVPWQAQKVDNNFMFFDRAPDAPVQAQPDQIAAVRNKPIRDLGVQDAYAAALERDTLSGYEEFIAAYPGDPMAKRVRALAAARREAIVWQRTYRADTPEAYWSYLRRYPNGPHAADARRRLAILTAPPEPPPSFAMYEYDVPPPPPEEIVYVDRPVLAFSDPYFDFEPPPPPPVFFLPPPPPEFVVLEPPPPPVGLFILPQPIFVPIPVYVRPPIYVRPPPNNIIYANIHNRRVIDTVINRPPPVTGRAGLPGGPQPGAAPGAASPALPPSVAQRATLIQQGRAPVPPSASINPAVRPGPTGAPGAPLGPRGGAAANAPLPANVAPTAPAPGQALPRGNALPVPGTRGAPPAPTSAARGRPDAISPNARPGGPPVQQGTAPGAAGAPATPGPAGSPAGPRGPTANVPPAAGTPRAGSPNPAARLPAPDSRRPGAVPPPTPPSAANAPARPNPAAAARPAPATAPAVRAPPPAAARPAPQLARPTPAPPPPRISAPPARIAAPPPQAPRMASPPPRPVAPPPQMARPAAPPPVARPMAAPPPMARPVAPPPIAARPVAAPPAASAAKRCPPGAPRC